MRYVASKIAAIATLSVGMLMSTAGVASAQKANKMTYDEAYKRCVATDMVGVPDETISSAGRYTRAAACMKKYGYRLKK